MTDSQVRGGHRSAAKRLVSRLAVFAANVNPVLSKEQQLFELEEGKKALVAKLDIIETYDAKMLALAQDDKEYQILSDAIEDVNQVYTDAIHSVGFKIQQLYAEVKPKIAPIVPSTPSTHSRASNLAKFDLPEFHGDILLWLQFWNIFEAEVDQNPSFSGATKFNYLNAKLKGEAKAALVGLAPTNDNYAEAVAILKKRYGQESKVIAALFRALYNLPRPNDSRASLREFSDRLESFIRGLESSGKSSLHFGDLLVCILLDKLSADVRRNLVRQHNSTEWTLEELREALIHEVEILDDVPEPFKRPSAKSSSSPQALVSVTTGAKGGGKVQAGRPVQNIHPIQQFTSTRRCQLCTGEHAAVDCLYPSQPEQRKEVARKKKLCFNCLSSKHSNARDCPSLFRCRVCQQAHHTCLHVDSAPVKAAPSVEVKPEAVTKTAAVAINAPRDSVDSIQPKSTTPFTFLKTAVADVLFKQHLQASRILLDEGAQLSFITSRLVAFLQLPPIRRVVLRLSGFSAIGESVQSYEVVKFSLLDLHRRPITIDAVVVDHILNPLEDPCREAAAKLPYLQGIVLAHPPGPASYFDVDILVGADYYWSIVKDKVIRGQGPTAVSSRLGYLLSSPMPNAFLRDPSPNILPVFSVLLLESFDLTRFWSLESMGIQFDDKQVDVAAEYQKNCIEFKDGQYTAQLFWKDSHPELLSNYHLCEKRTRQTIKRLALNPLKLKCYDSIIKDQISRGFVEKVPGMALLGSHHITHFAVEKDSRTTPVRIVFDCATKDSNGTSLNDCLESGPALQNNMLDILLRFRIWKYGIAFDVEKAFHRVKLHPKDQDYTRFMWLVNGQDPNSAFEILRFCVLPFGANCCPFILLCVIIKHLSQYLSKVAIDILFNLYIDNLASGRDSVVDVLDYYQQSNVMFNAAGLPLKVWGSNATALEEAAREEGLLDSSIVSNILGLEWNRETDTLRSKSFSLQRFSHDLTTKRDVLKGISTVFDPLGFYSPLTIAAKILIQELWKGGYGWDVPLPAELRKRWAETVHSLDNVQVEIPRSYLGSSAAVQRLQVFVDASHEAFGATAFIDDYVNSSFVASKSRVCPLQMEGREKPTIPLMELMAALLGIQLATTIINSFKKANVSLKEVVLWGDNQSVLFWIDDPVPHKCKVVRNRVSKIQDFNVLHKAKWRFVPTDQNPADLMTRVGVSLQQFHSSKLWRSGPDWLTDENAWPIWDISSMKNPKVSEIVIPLLSAAAAAVSSEGISNLIEPSRLKWSTLLRVTARVHRVCQNFKLTSQGEPLLTGPISASELLEAEITWIKSIQRRFMADELKYLEGDKRGRRPVLVSQLDLFIDTKGVIRCGGRLRHSLLQESAKHPILIPKQSILCDLIIQSHHERMMHGGISTTVCSIRQRFWICSIRQQVKSVLRRCATCKKMFAAPYSTPDHAPLPDFRVTYSHPFTYTGVDYTGAIPARDRDDKVIKCYISLFTCAASRAIHLEVVEDLTTGEFTQACRRFVSHHSIPRVMLSDNATNFKGAAKMLKTLVKRPELSAFFADHQIEWRFIPKRAPWYGGFWERLVGLTKDALMKMVGRTRLSLGELRTIVAEIEAILNDRPLTQVGSSIDEADSLTPSLLMYGKRLTTLPYLPDGATMDDPDYDADPTPSDLSRRQALRRQVMTTFQKIWQHNYLVALREFHQATKGKHTEIIKVGDVVQVHHEGPRVEWKLAIVEGLIRSKDGQVRAADIRTATGKSNRPIA